MSDRLSRFHVAEMYLGQRLAWVGDCVATFGEWLVSVGEGWSNAAALRSGKSPRKLPETSGESSE